MTSFDDLASSLRTTLAAAAAALACCPIAEALAQPSTIGTYVQKFAHPRLPCNPDFRVVDVSPDVTYACIQNAIAPSGGLDVNVEVLASAHHGSLFLRFNHPWTSWPELAGYCSLRVQGEHGVRVGSFASGMAISDLRAWINAYSSQTGVTAILTHSGWTTSFLHLKSLRPGGSAFVSVEVITLEAGPLWNVSSCFAQSNDANAPDLWTEQPFIEGSSRFASGREVFARVNGFYVLSTAGNRLRHRTPALSADIDLTLGPAAGAANAQTLGWFRAFRILPP